MGEQNKASGFVLTAGTMKDCLSANLILDPDQPDAPPYRPFRTRPSGVWVQRVLDHIRKTGAPETFVGLYGGKIDRDARFFILRKVLIDRHKRPNGDKAPCSRCGCDDKFLDGALAWFPDLQFCSVIGHCCAAKEHVDEAEREYKWREKRDKDESYLLENLPKLYRKAAALDALRPSAAEARRIYRQFRHEMRELHQHLREIKSRRGGQLTVAQILRDTETDSDYFGPAGFKGRGPREIESRDIELGVICGLTAVEKNYDPLKAIDEALRVIDSYEMRFTESAALNFITRMDEAKRHAAVHIVKLADRHYSNISQKLSDFWSFFSRGNIELLHIYGTHPDGPLAFEASYQSDGERTLVTIRRRMQSCRLSFANELAEQTVNWPD